MWMLRLIRCVCVCVCVCVNAIDHKTEDDSEMLRCISSDCDGPDCDSLEKMACLAFYLDFTATHLCSTCGQRGKPHTGRACTLAAHNVCCHSIFSSRERSSHNLKKSHPGRPTTRRGDGRDSGRA